MGRDTTAAAGPRGTGKALQATRRRSGAAPEGAAAAASNSKTSRAPTAIDIQVGENIRRERLNRNMTLAELGAEVGISHQQLQKYETGANRLSAGMLWVTADVLGVSVLDLYGDAGADPEADNEAVDEVVRMLSDAATRCTEAARIVRHGRVRRVLKHAAPASATIHPLQAAQAGGAA